MTDDAALVQELIEDYRTKNFLWNSRGLDLRIGKVAGLNHYEICLKHLLFQLRQAEQLMAKEILEGVHYWKRQVLADIIKACYAVGMKPEAHVKLGHGNFVVHADVKSYLYLEYLALQIQLLPSWEIRPFLDFQLVNCYDSDNPNGDTGSKGKAELSDTQMELLIGMEHTCRHFLNQHQVKEGSQPRADTEQWLSARYDRMSLNELSRLRGYKWEEPATLRISPFKMQVKDGTTRTINAGCSEPYLQTFFSLLKKRPPNGKKGSSYVDPSRVNYILYRYFGLGEPAEYDETIEVLADRNQLCQFAMEFIRHRGHRKQGYLTIKRLLEIFQAEFPEVFKGASKETIARNYKTYAGAAVMGHLNWKDYPDVKAVVEKEKNL